MSNPLVSVIIPVYNTAKYIRETIASLQQQSLSDFEVILINDGSTDESLTIMEELASKDARFHVYSYSNGGLSIARNRGLEYVRGKFIYFFDSDDLLASDCLRRCVERAERDQLDLLFFNGEAFIDKSPTIKKDSFNYNQTKYFEEGKIYVGTDALLKKYQMGTYSSQSCLIFYRTSFLLGTALKFIPNIIHEDEHFTPMVYLLAQRVGMIAEPFFKRRFRSNSIMTTEFAWRNIVGYLTVSDTLLTYKNTQEDKHIRNIIDTHLHYMLPAVVWRAHVLPLSQRFRLLFICLRRYPSYIPFISYVKMFFKETLDNLRGK
ncbi:MAG: glycosyltransferase [Bacteroidaceae bacterium]